MAGITNIVELQAKLKAMSPSQVRQVARLGQLLQAKLKAMSPSQVRQVARLGQLHAKLVRQSRRAHGLTVTQAKVLAKLERSQCGLR
jgi:hypothetical protein